MHKGSVLLVEDDMVDVMTVKRAFKDINVLNELNVASNGLEALEFLRAEEREHPALILLDLNMPKMNGIEFLHVIKADDDLKRIPVIVLTTSKEQEDKVESFNFGVAGYMIKPVEYSRFINVVKTIDAYWSLSEIAD